jgi:ABC-2 type transport system ATP-binding protein
VEVRGDRLSIRVRAEALPPETLLEELRTAGASVRMFQPESLELETAFIKLTEGKTA